MATPPQSALVWHTHPWTLRLLMVSVVLAVVGTVTAIASGQHGWAILTALGAAGLFVHLVALAWYQYVQRRH